MKNIFKILAVATFLVAFMSGCAQTYQQRKSYTPDGQVKSKHTYKETANKVETYDYDATFHDKTLIATGVFVNKNETIALNMATNMAINNLAKSVGNVLQAEDSTLYNDKVHMIITTKARNIVKGFQIISQTYDRKLGRAEVTIKQDGKVLATELTKEMSKYK